MKIFVITFGDPETGSTKYRIMQYRSFFETEGIALKCVSQSALKEEHLKEIEECDCLINQKSLFPLGFSRKIRRAAKKVIFDYDDAIYTRPGKPFSWLTQLRVNFRLNYWLKHADIVTVANHHLRIYAERRGACTIVIPMALDMNEWQYRERDARTKKTVHIGWAGAPVNLHHIERLDPILQVLLRENPNLKLFIYSGVKPKMECPFEFIPYQEGSEQSFVQQLDIGLLPLSEDEFSMGKSPIKAIQYLACGVPVVGNVNGATGEILNGHNSIPVTTRDEWINGIRKLIENPADRREMGQQGRQHVERYNNFSLSKVEFFKLLQSLVSTSSSQNGRNGHKDELNV